MASRPALPLGGIHHITVLASDPQRNADFYTEVLGLRLVKKTVNFDSPGVYHLYYGDAAGTPGTLLTFFPYPDAARGKRGSGEIHAIGYAIPHTSIDYWIHRLSVLGIAFDGPIDRYGEEVISFLDPDGLKIELVATPSPGEVRHWKNSPVEASHAPRRFSGVTMAYLNDTWSQQFLTDTMGFRKGVKVGKRSRFIVAEGESVDTVVLDGVTPPRPSAGSVHHIAWRVPDEAAQLVWRERLIRMGTYPTEVIDRQYFRSIYFREPGGVLFEIATDSPGFGIDETPETLGTRLMLPPQHESLREQVERTLVPLQIKNPAPNRIPVR